MIDSDDEALPAWVRCDCCENYLCTIHGKHVHDCECPPVEEWPVSPYDAAVTPQVARWLGERIMESQS